jgi:hypothetical protein
MPGYSQAPRGLSVQPRVSRVFTRPSISPGPLPRQRPSRYAFRAGRNLPDKEFRYLRTVIVTAAVHWGFGSGLAPVPLTFQHRAGVSPYTSACAFAETCVFGKQSLGLFRCGPLGLVTLPGPPFSRSYGGILPSSLARVLPRALRFSRRLPVSVCGTGGGRLARGFSWQCRIGHFGTELPSPSPLRTRPGGFASRDPLGGLDGHDQRPAAPTSLRPPVARDGDLRYRNLHRLSIAYALRPRLRSRLTLSGRSFLRNP